LLQAPHVAMMTQYTQRCAIILPPDSIILPAGLVGPGPGPGPGPKIGSRSVPGPGPKGPGPMGSMGPLGPMGPMGPGRISKLAGRIIEQL